jgi:Tol biopolymer transport system component
MSIPLRKSRSELYVGRYRFTWEVSVKLGTVALGVLVVTAISTIAGTAQESSTQRVTVSWHDGPENIYEVNSDGSVGRRLTNAPEGRGAWVPDFSPDCREIVFASNMEDGGAASIYVMHADGANVRRLTHSEGSDYWPNYSPDGSRIFFLRTIAERQNVWVMKRNGSGQRQLIDGTHESSMALMSLSPDSSRFVVSATPPGAPKLRVQPTVQAAGADLYVVDLAEVTVQRLTIVSESTHANIGGRWSRDGSRIAFTSNRDGNWEVYTMDADGAHQRQLTHTEGDNTVNIPVGWSPDDRQIAFVSSKGNGGKNAWIFVDVYLIDAATGDERRLTHALNEGGFARALGWDEKGIGGMWSADGNLQKVGQFRLEGSDFTFVESNEPARHGSECDGGSPNDSGSVDTGSLPNQPLEQRAP